jgi:hypothetical protein
MTARQALHQLVDELPEDHRAAGSRTSATPLTRTDHRLTPRRSPLWIVVSQILLRVV